MHKQCREESSCYADCEKSTTISKYFSATPTEEGKTVEEAVVKNDKPKVVEEKSVEQLSQPIIRYISLNSIQMKIGIKCPVSSFCKILSIFAVASGLIVVTIVPN